MIKTITIENFQSHKLTELELDKGVNIIVGATDSGKSSILRAVNFGVNNKPNGDDFRSYWGGETSVQFDFFDNSNVITRKRRSNHNSYELNDMEFLAFGQDIPQEIKEAFNMNSVNFQFQLDSVFLLSSTPGAVAAHFNKMANLTIIDKTQHSIQYGVKKNGEVLVEGINTINSDIEHKRKTIQEAESRIIELDWIDEFESDLVRVEAMENALNKAEGESLVLSRLINQVGGVNKEIEEVSDVITLEKEVAYCIRLQKELNTLTTYRAEFRELSIEYHEALSDEKKYKKLTVLEKEVGEAIKNIDSLEESGLFCNVIESLVNSTTNNLKRIKRAQMELKTKEDYFHDNFPSQCPLCLK